MLTLTLTINNKGKRSKDSEVAELTVEFANLSNGDEVEDWYEKRLRKVQIILDANSIYFCWQ